MSSKRFIVIEPSIKSESGHYLQYALSVLRAATPKGFTPMLACHKDFPVKPVDGVEVLPVFTNTFWHRFATAAQTRGKVSRAYFHAIRIRNGIFLRLTAYWYLSKPYVVLGHITGPIVSNRYSGTLLKIIALPYFLVKKVWDHWRFKELRLRIYRKVYRTDERLFDDSNKRNIPVITQDILFLHDKAKLTSDDHLLMATVSGAELEGLLAAIEQRPELNAATWHLVFRRNMRPFPTAPFGEDLETKLLRNNLDRFQKAQPNVKLYTDTDALTFEYDALAKAKLFGTLPIPHVHGRTDDNAPQAPLIITYMGDARPEKGFQYLSRIAQAVRLSLLETGKARFRLQANFNSADGDPECVFSRTELERFPESQVELLLSPQSEEEYLANLQSSGLILIPYDVNNYSQRSSGIFAEAAAMEVPVIVPAGTWMSRQLCRDNYERIALTFDQLKKVKRGDLHLIPAGTAPTLLNPLEERWFALGDEPRFIIAATPEKGAVEAVLKITLTKRWYARLRIIQRDADGVLISLDQQVLEVIDETQPTDTYTVVALDPAAASLEIEVRSANLSETSGSIELAFTSQSTRIGNFKAGEIYFDWTEIPHLIELVVANHGCYAKIAHEFAKGFKEFHSGPSFMKELGL